MKTTKTNCNEKQNDYNDLVCIQNLTSEIDNNELQAFKNVAGYCVSRLNQECSSCVSFGKQQTVDDSTVDFISCASFKKGSLTRPSEQVVTLLSYANNLFSQEQHNLQKEKNIVKKLVDSMMMCDIVNTFPQCHNMARDLVSRFFRIRLGVYTKQLTVQSRDNKNNVSLSSKTVAMKQAVQKY